MIPRGANLILKITKKEQKKNNKRKINISNNFTISY